MVGQNQDVEQNGSPDHLDDRRKHIRFPFHVKVPLRLLDPQTGLARVEPCLLLDMSASGASGITRHPLHLGQRVTLSIPTTLCDGVIPLPEYFLGPAEVVWVCPGDECRVRGAFRFSCDLTNNADFQVFADHARLLVQTHP